MLSADPSLFFNFFFFYCYTATLNQIEIEAHADQLTRVKVYFTMYNFISFDFVAFAQTLSNNQKNTHSNTSGHKWNSTFVSSVVLLHEFIYNFYLHWTLWMKRREMENISHIWQRFIFYGRQKQSTQNGVYLTVSWNESPILFCWNLTMRIVFSVRMYVLSYEI